MIDDRTKSIVIWVVTGVWAANFLASVFGINGYHSSESINGIFTAIVGGLFAINARRTETKPPPPEEKDQ